MEYKITIPGNPVAKGRPRVGKFGTYTPKKTEDFESYVKYCWAAEYGSIKPSDKPLDVSIIFDMPIPKSASKKAKASMDIGETKHVKKPDLDNMAKAVLDSLNGLAYIDDSQIFSLTLYKTYSEQPGTFLKITESE